MTFPFRHCEKPDETQASASPGLGQGDACPWGTKQSLGAASVDVNPDVTANLNVNVNLIVVVNVSIRSTDDHQSRCAETASVHPNTWGPSQ